MALQDRAVAGFRLSPQQRHLWMQQEEGMCPLYRVQGAVAIEGDLDAVSLRAAIGKVVDRHEILRTFFHRSPEMILPLQTVGEGRVELPVEELSDGADLQAAVEARWDEEASTIGLEQGDPLRLRLLTFSSQHHVLLLALPSLYMDRTGLRSLVHEIAEAYAGREEQDAPMQYADLSEWQNGLLEGEDAGPEGSHWRQPDLFSRLAARLPFETKSPRPFDPRILDLALDPGLSGGLSKIAKRLDTSMSVVLLTAWRVLLGRLTGELDVPVGMLFDGRSYEVLEGALGLFAKYLPISSAVREEARFIDVVVGTDREVREAYEAQEYFGWDLPQDGGDPRSQARYFPYCFELEKAPAKAQASAGTWLRLEREYACIDRFHLKLSCLLDGGLLRCEIQYDAGMLHREDVERLGEQLRALLESVVRNPGTPVGELSLLGEAERMELLAAFNDTAIDFPGDRCVHRRFEACAALAPGAPALIFENRSLTYQELNQRANRLAHYLRRADVGPESLVALFLERSEHSIVALLAVLKAGGAYVALDPRQPRERLAALLGPVSLVIAQESLVAGLPAPESRLIRLDADHGLIERESCDDLQVEVAAENLAYVLFTSGSTGEPKGVAVEHRQLTSYTDAVMERLGLPAGGSFATVSTLAADLGHTMVFPALCTGGGLHLISEERILAAEALIDYRRHHRLDCLKIVPSHFEALMAAASEPGALLPAQHLILGGEALRWDLIEKLERLDPACRVFNHYGPTETTVGVLTFPVHLGERVPGAATVPLGRPLGNCRIYLLDRSFLPVATWVPGEVHICGANVTRGYLGRPAETAEKFVPDPFSETPGARLYRTGDLARHLPDAGIEFLGRIDHQVKIRGFRIELGEIETVLASHPAVRRAVVVARHDDPEAVRLVAYVVVGDTEVRSEDLRSHLAERLPEPMIPAAFVPLKALPLTANGKIDRKALPPPPDQSRPASGVAYVAPRTLIERSLAEIWSELLRVERVGIHDSFFTLGGHSLLVMQLVARIREELHVDVALARVAGSRTLADLAVAVSQERMRQGLTPREEDGLPSAAPDPEHLYEPFPLSEIQQAYWIGRNSAFELSDVSTHNYVEIEGPNLDLDRLTRALHGVVARHAMLRAVMLADGRQRILSEVPPYEIQVLDLRDMEPAEASSRLEELRHRLSHQVLPAEQWPLFELRATLLDGDHMRLHIYRDALIFDVLSASTVFADLMRLYEDPGALFPPLELSFRDYVLAEEALKRTRVYQESWDYWMGRLSDLPPAPQLPLAKNPASLTTSSFSGRHGWLTADQWQKLKQRGAKAGLTPTGVILGAFAEVLAAWSRQSRFTLNLTLFNRLPLHPQVNQLVGDFTSLTLLEVESPGEEPFELRARRLQEQLWDDLDHRYVSGVRVLRELAHLQRSVSRALMPVVLTSTLSLDRGFREAPTLSWPGRIVYGLSETSQVWLDHSVSEREEALSFGWNAVEELFAPGVLDAMFGAYCGLLERLSEQEEAWNAPAPGLLPTEQRRLWESYNETALELPEATLHGLFEQRAQADPRRPAVISAARRLDYGELERRSRALGRRLREQGARPNRLVGVVMEKGWEQVVAVLGVLRAGAAYLPVDPGLPRERLWHLLSRGGVEVVVTQPWLEPRLEWPSGVARLVVEAVEEDAGGELEPVTSPQDLAYVIFTSGSTGEPKGVMIDHRGAVNTVLDVNRRYGIGEQDRVLALSSLSFDLSVYDVFGLLACGGALVMPEAESLRDPARWLEWLAGEGVAVWNTVPALMEMLVEHASARPEAAVGSLRRVLLSGDWIPVSLPERIRSLYPESEVIGLGGATEASIWSIAYPIGDVDAEWVSIPYGRPLSNQRMYVLDEHLEPRPLWVAGELYIGGVGVALGYWGDAERTSASFVTHPRTGERLYRTGDLGRMLPEGWIEFLGREDAQVKVQGHRIELGEIEAALLRHPSVQAAVAAAVGNDHSNRRLVAYVVPKREQAATRLPEPSAERPPLPARRERPHLGVGALLDPIALLEFKLSEPGLRSDADELPLSALPLDRDLDRCRQRRSWREFVPEPVSPERLGRVLSCLMPARLDELPLPKYRYPSAGSLYPVQAYVHVKPGRVAGIEGGIYYYDPREHTLVLLASGPVIDRSLHAETNHEVFDSSAFSLLLVGRPSVVVPLYGDLSADFCRLEAGYIGQLLMEEGIGSGIGFCPIGSMAFDEIRHLLDLEEDQELVHVLVGGGVVPGRSGEMGAAPTLEVRPSLRAEETAPNPSHGSLSGDLAERLNFKQREPGIRQDLGDRLQLRLARPELDEDLLRLYRERRTHREFLPGAVDLEDLGRLLGCLSQAALEDFPLPKYRYPSAGNLYPMQVYLYVKPDRVEGLAGSFYYYDPKHHRLARTSEEARLHRAVYSTNNQPIFDQAAFCLLLVEQPAAIRPVYGERARSFSLLEAGYMGQLLMTEAPAWRLGLCPIGTLDFDRVRGALRLEPGQELLHSFLGGAVAGGAKRAGAPRSDRELEPAADPGRDREQALIEDLRTLLESSLPDYMVPADLFVLDGLPLTPNGKVNRSALPLPGGGLLPRPKKGRAPRNPLELQLVRIWEDLFASGPIGVEDDFFELGGDSLMAVRLAAQVRSRLGHELPLARLLRGATIEQLAASLQSGEDASPPSPLVPIQVAPGTPFFCVHAVGGGVLHYVELAYHLGPDRPFYGLQAIGRDDDREPLRTVEEMAGCYVEAIRQVQPRDPYLLGGWSFGGHVAFEMARQLAASGEEVAFVGLFDTFSAGGGSGEEPLDAEILAMLLAQDLPISVDLLQQQGDVDRQLAYLVERGKQENLLPPDFELAQARRYFDLGKTNLNAARAYAPGQFPGRVTLFRAAETLEAVEGDARMGWDLLALQGLEMHVVPGGHQTLIRAPHVRVLAARLKECLERIDRPEVA